MERRIFVKNSLLSLFAMTSLNDLKKLSDTFSSHESKMPLLFVGHGSPMNAIEDNEFSKKWRSLGKELPKPQAILCISAHWETRGTFVTAMQKPKTIHDFGGFPRPLSEMQYPAPGAPFLAERVAELLRRHHALPAAELIQVVYRAVVDFSEGTRQADDLTAVIVKRLGG